jgi:hypothetical protein
MQMSELLGRPVVDVDGQRIGRVSDIRLVQDGPYLEGFGDALRLDALVVGRGGVASRLGFVRGGVRGPWPLRAMAAALEGRALLVPWTDVEVTDAGLTVRRSRSDLRLLRDAVAS